MYRWFLLRILIAWLFLGGSMFLSTDRTGSFQHQSVQALAAETVQQKEGSKDIQWFKKTMKIAPKYQKETTGILGMSWAHFILMVFLLLFFAATLINYYTRSRRTKKILLNILQEEKSEQS